MAVVVKTSFIPTQAGSWPRCAHDNDCSLSSIDETTAMQDCPTAEPDSDAPEKSDVSKREVKPYKCIHCSKAFTQQNRLKTHERIPTGVKLYKCTYCNKAFRLQGDLKRHENINTNIRPYKCTHCSKTFT